MSEKDKITEEKIFDAAVEEFEEKGMDGSRMQKIADRAGINKALLHYYYRSKDKLFQQVFDRLANKLLDRLLNCLDNDFPLEKKLKLFYMEHIRFMQKHPKMPAFIFHELNRNPERIQTVFNSERIRFLRENLFRQIDEEKSAGEIRNIDNLQLFINIIALSAFPFVARGLLESILKVNNIQFDDFIEARKTELPEFVINSVKMK